ncbi:MAG: peptide chain release factor 2 [Pseudomonadota bacterium]|nr:peptide chain release factor 2 [Pseudomonadota bacterium]
MRAEIENKIIEIRNIMKLLRRHLDWDNSILRIEEINSLIDDENFWTDQSEAKKIMKERVYLENSIQNYKQLENRLNDIIEIINLGEEEGDEQIISDGEEEINEILKLSSELELQNLLNGEADANDCYLEIHAGAGGTEAQDWAEMISRMYSRWSTSRSYKVELIEESVGEEAGIKSQTIKISGLNAFGWLKTESGVHRLVRISPFDSSSRRHTSFASVWVYPVVDKEISVNFDEKDCRVDTYRSSGAGGQHVNKTDSAVRITHNPTKIVVQCQSERSQHQNRAKCWDMLRAKLYERELKNREERLKETEELKSDIGWGSQIRSYILQPYQLVKDLRTGFETSDTQRVLDGDIDDFMAAALAIKVKTIDELKEER